MENLNKKKILFLLPDLSGGGAERVTLEIIKSLNQTLYEIKIILLNQKIDYPLPNNIVELINLGKNTPFDTIKIIPKLHRIIIKEKPDLIFSVLDAAHIVTFFSLRVSAGKYPWIINEQNVQSEAIDEQNYKRLKKQILKSAYKASDKVIVVSEQSKNDLIKNFNVKEHKIAVIENCIDVEYIKLKSAEDIPENEKHIFQKPTIISAGRLVKIKGLEYLIRAVKNIRDVNLLLVGSGSEKDNLVTLTKELKLENRVFFMPFQKNPWKYIKRADLFVLPSLREGLPLSILEAMACEVPLILTRTSTIAESIEGDKCGIVVSPKDIKQLEDSIAEILKNNDLRNILIKRGLVFLKKYELKSMTNKYNDIIAKTLH